MDAIDDRLDELSLLGNSEIFELCCSDKSQFLQSVPKDEWDSLREHISFILWRRIAETEGRLTEALFEQLILHQQFFSFDASVCELVQKNAFTEDQYTKILNYLDIDSRARIEIDGRNCLNDFLKSTENNERLKYLQLSLSKFRPWVVARMIDEIDESLLPSVKQSIEASTTISKRAREGLQQRVNARNPKKGHKK